MELEAGSKGPARDLTYTLSIFVALFAFRKSLRKPRRYIMVS
jgi:hypothetical protein